MGYVRGAPPLFDSSLSSSFYWYPYPLVPLPLDKGKGNWLYKGGSASL